MADARDDGFLNRWARRKQRAVRAPKAKPAEGPDEVPPTAEPEVAEAERAQAQARRQELIDSLPEPEAMGPDDDYTQFLRDGVPDDLRQRALHRLWKSNPVFANLDGLNDYDLDYTDAATVVENLKTAFQVGRGMVTKEEREAEAAAAERARRGEREPAETAADTTTEDPADGHADAADGEAAAGEPAHETDGGPRADGTAIEDAPGVRTRYRQTPDGRLRVKGSAAQRRWGG